VPPEKKGEHMARERLRESLKRLHGKIIEILARKGIDGETRQLLREAAQEALTLSQELEDAPGADKGLLTRIFDFLSRWLASSLR